MRRVPHPRRKAHGARRPQPGDRARAPRELVAAIIGAEAGAGIGLLVVGGTPFAPLLLAALGAGAGASGVYARNLLVRRWLRAQMRGAR
jgi:hypothetical protein